jgi:hypothetical protein
VGPDVKGLKIVDHAAGIPVFSMVHHGAYGDSVVLPAAVMVRLRLKRKLIPDIFTIRHCASVKNAAQLRPIFIYEKRSKENK